MSNAQHAQLARDLIRACGGARKAAALCRLERSRLYEFEDETGDAYMPADIIADLEEYCGDPIYSRGLVENRPSAVEPGRLVDETSSLTEISASLQAYARSAVADDVVTRVEKRQLLALLAKIKDQIRSAEAAIERGRP